MQGIYGVGLAGLGDTDLMCSLPDGALELRILRRRAVGPPPELELRENKVTLPYLDGGWCEIDAAAGVAELFLVEELTLDDLVHPWLAPPVGIFNVMNGRLVLHGGVVEVGGLVFGLVGEREAGKSSLLAHLMLTLDADVLSDDLVTLLEGDVLRGPACVDLRAASVEAFGLSGRTARSVRLGTRVRMPVPAGPWRAPLAGIVVLEWAEELSIEPVAPLARVPVLLPHVNRLGPPFDAADRHLLDLIDIPVWRLRRPRRWSALPETAELLVQLSRYAR
jgi:hypothetical protein